MSQIVDLVENAIVADLKLDDQIAQWLPRVHDAPGLKGGDSTEAGQADQEKPYAITVTAEDRGDFKGAPGCGIKLVGVQIEVVRNFGDAIENPPPDAELGRISGRIDDRLPATQEASKSRHEAFCNSRLKVYGIMADEAERRTDVDLTRLRVITRELICVQLA